MHVAESVVIAHRFLVSRSGEGAVVKRRALMLIGVLGLLAVIAARPSRSQPALFVEPNDLTRSTPTLTGPHLELSLLPVWGTAQFPGPLPDALPPGEYLVGSSHGHAGRLVVLPSASQPYEMPLRPQTWKASRDGTEWTFICQLPQFAFAIATSDFTAELSPVPRPYLNRKFDISPSYQPHSAPPSDHAVPVLPQLAREPARAGELH